MKKSAPSMRIKSKRLSGRPEPLVGWWKGRWALACQQGRMCTFYLRTSLKGDSRGSAWKTAAARGLRKKGNTSPGTRQCMCSMRCGFRDLQSHGNPCTSSFLLHISLCASLYKTLYNAAPPLQLLHLPHWPEMRKMCCSAEPPHSLLLYWKWELVLITFFSF